MPRRPMKIEEVLLLDPDEVKEHKKAQWAGRRRTDDPIVVDSKDTAPASDFFETEPDSSEEETVPARVPHWITLDSLAKGERKKPFGHRSYTRRTKSGKTVFVQSKGYKPAPAQEAEGGEVVGLDQAEEWWLNNLEKPFTIKYNDCRYMHPEEKAFYYLLKKRKVETIFGMRAAMRVYLRQLDGAEYSDEDVDDMCATILTKWSDVGWITVNFSSKKDKGIKFSDATQSHHKELFKDTFDTYCKTLFDFEGTDGDVTVFVSPDDTLDARGRRGWIVRGRYIPGINIIEVAKNNKWASFVHEWGHYLDHKLAKMERNKASIDDLLLNGHSMASTYASYMHGTPVYDLVMKLRQADGYKNHLRTCGDVDYFSASTEILARFVNEWMHYKTQAAKVETPLVLSHSAYNEWNLDPKWPEFVAEWEKVLDHYKIDWKPKVKKAMQLLIDLSKAKKPYGHVAYERRDPRTGKEEHVGAKGHKPEQVRYSKHTDKPWGITFNKPDGLHEVEEDFFNLCVKKNVSTLAQFRDAIGVFLKKLDGKEPDPSDVKYMTAKILKKWSKGGHITVDRPEVEPQRKQAKPAKDKKVLWKKLVHPGVELPAPYKPRGIPVAGKKNAVAEEMGFSIAKYLLAENPKARPDAVFLKNFSDDLKKYSGISVAPTLPAMKKAFAGVMKAWEKDAKKPKDKPKKGAEKTAKTHPFEFVIKDGQPDKMAVPRNLAGHIFIGTSNADVLNAKNMHRGRWLERVEAKDVILNGTNFPKGWKGGTVTKPSNEWYTAIRVPAFAKKEGIIYVRPEHIEGKLGSKWEGVAAFSWIYKKLMDHARADLHSKDATLREVATALVCLDTFHPRVDSDPENVEKTRRGLTSLTRDQIWTKGNEIHFHFIGKSNDVFDSREMGPGKVATAFKAALSNIESMRKTAKKGDRIFSITDEDINKYVQQFDPHAHAHHFRHYWGTHYFTKILQESAPSIRKRIEKKGGLTKSEANSVLNDMLARAGKKLGHRIREKTNAKGKKVVTGTATARDNYVHPALLVQAMKLLGHNLASKKQMREKEFDELKQLQKSLIDEIEWPAVYEDRWFDTIPVPDTDQMEEIMHMPTTMPTGDINYSLVVTR